MLNKTKHESKRETRALLQAPWAVQNTARIPTKPHSGCSACIWWQTSFRKPVQWESERDVL